MLSYRFDGRCVKLPFDSNPGQDSLRPLFSFNSFNQIFTASSVYQDDEHNRVFGVVNNSQIVTREAQERHDRLENEVMLHTVVA